MSLLRKLGIERGEEAVFGWGVAALLLTGCADISLKNVSETFFLKRVGVDLLPLLFLVNSLLLVATTYTVGRAVSRRDRLQLFPHIFAGFALLLLPLWLLVRANVDGVFSLLLIVSKQLPSIVLMVFVVAMGDLLDGRQAKRLFAPLMAGVTVGTIAGSFASGALGRSLGIANLLPCASLALLGAAFCALRLRDLRPPRLDAAGDAPPAAGAAAPPAPPLPLATFRRLWRESGLFRLLFLTASCSGLLGPMLYFQFSYVADRATSATGEPGLLALYAQLRGWISVGILSLQLAVTSRLYRRIGVPLASAFSPLVYLLGFLGLSVRLSLPAGVGAMAGTKLQDEAVYDPAQRILFNLLPESVRARATGLLEGPVKRAGGALGNAVVIAAIAIGGAIWVGYVAIPVALVWMAVAAVLWRAYPALLLQVSARRARFGEAVDLSEMLDAATLRGLRAELTADEPERCRAAIELVCEAQPELSAVTLAEAARHAPQPNRSLLVAALDRVLEARVSAPVRSQAAADAVEMLLADPGALDARGRADLVQAYGRLAEGSGADADAHGVLEHALADPSPAVRLAAAAALHRRGVSTREAPDLDASLAAAAAGSDAAARRTAREEYRALLLCEPSDAAWPERLRTLAGLLALPEEGAEVAEAIAEVAMRHGPRAALAADAMLARRDDPDPRIGAAVMRFAGYAGLEREAPWLVEHVAGGRGFPAAALRAAAQEGLRALGPRVADLLLVELSYGKRSTRDALLPIVREMNVDVKTLRELYERELQSIHRKLVHLYALSNPARSAIVLQRLQERLSEGLHTALLFLTAIHGEKRIGELGDLLQRTRSRRHRAVLLEALESLLGPHEKAQLIPLLDDDSLAQRGRLAARALGISVPSPADATRELLEDYDEITRRLVAATLRDEAAAAPLAAPTLVPENEGMLSPVEIALHLKGLPIFEGLTVRQLMDVSGLVREEVHPPGVPVVREGDYADSLYLIIEGAVEISKGRTRLREMGPKDFFGEIAVFEGATRSATVATRTRVRLLRLQRDDLLRLMEDLPGIAICICQTLSRRVRELTDRLQV